MGDNDGFGSMVGKAPAGFVFEGDADLSSGDDQLEGYVCAY